MVKYKGQVEPPDESQRNEKEEPIVIEPSTGEPSRIIDPTSGLPTDLPTHPARNNRENLQREDIDEGRSAQRHAGNSPQQTDEDFG